MTNQQLMNKYEVSPNQLQNIFKQLIRAGVIGEIEALDVPGPPHEKIHISDKRKQRRSHVFVQLPVYDAQNLLDQGTVLGVSEKGVRISGIPAPVGSTREFMVQADEFADVFPFVFEACCQWSMTDDDNCVAGFQITTISDGGLAELRRLVDVLAVTD